MAETTIQVLSPGIGLIVYRSDHHTKVYGQLINVKKPRSNSLSDGPGAR